MRTFHIGGAAQLNEQSFVEANFDGKIAIKNKAIAKNSEGHLVAMVRNMVLAIPMPTAPSVRRTVFSTARACTSMKATWSSVASASPSGTRTRVRFSPRSKERSASRIWSKAS